MYQFFKQKTTFAFSEFGDCTEAADIRTDAGSYGLRALGDRGFHHGIDRPGRPLDPVLHLRTAEGAKISMEVKSRFMALIASG